MPNQDIRIAGQLPAHFREQYPAFIAFLRGYYAWLHRTDNVTPHELSSLQTDTSWQTVDIDGFIRTGDQALAGQNPLLDKIQERPPGTELDLLADDYTMERRFEVFETADGDTFEDQDTRPMELTRVNDKHIDEWFTSFDFVKTTDNLIEDYGRFLDSGFSPYLTNDYKNIVLLRTGSGQRYRTLDNIRLLKVLKHIYAIRGTEKSAQLFFSIFFGEPVDTYNPKDNIMVADESMIPDSLNSLRDDDYYNEFSYVILTTRDPVVYDYYFRTIFLKHFHPAGFKVFMQQRQVT